MKKIGLFLIASAVAFTSCDILNGDPDDSFTKDNYFTSEKNIELFANEFYNEFAGYDGAMSTAVAAVQSYEANFYYACLSDDQASTGTENWLYKNAPATNPIWSNAYTRIRRANTILEQLPNIASMNDAAKANWEGVARMIRAFEHYKLVRCFGDVYFVDRVLKIEDGDVLYGKRHNRSDVMDKVLEDINFAVNNIATVQNTTAWSKDLARAIKAEICLYEGGYSKYTLKDNARAEKFYKEVKTACEGIFEQSYELGEYQANFNSPDLSSNKEMIFFKKYVWGQYAHSLVDYTCGSTQTHGMTKDAFDAYLGVDGKPCAAGTDRGVIRHELAADGHVAADHDVIDISACLAMRDPRLSAAIDNTLLFPGCGWQRFGGAESTSSTGYGVALFDNPVLATDAWGGNKRRQSINGNDTDAPIYWLALEYLNYAEACAELGDDATAKQYIDKIRTRANMPSVDVTLTAAGTTVLQEVRRERRVEMMYAKNDRYWSLIRWNELEKLDTKLNPDVNRGAYVQGLLPAEVLAQVSVDADGYINCKGDGVDREYDTKHNLFPIPSGERTLNPEIGQNPGW